MKISFLDNHRLRQASEYFVAVLLCVPILGFLLKLWRADLRIPFNYNGDALLHTMFIKGIVNNGWYWQNPSLGAPYGLQMYDFPGGDNLAAAIIVVIGLFDKDPFLALNIFYLLTFPLVIISSLYVLRQFNLSFAPALFASLLYTFLPYHFVRGEGHLFLSAYYFIPLVVMVLLWVASDRLTDERRRFGINLRSSKFIFSVVICILLGSSNIYYSFFACFLFLVAGIAAAVVRRNLRPFLAPVVLVVITVAVVSSNLAPSILYRYKHGDAGITKRNLGESEIYGLKVAQLLLPITGHRVRQLNVLKGFYNQNTLLTESDAAALGLAGSIGFLALLAQFFYRRNALDSNLEGLSILNLFAVLLGTIGGFGSLFNLFVSPAIRSYNRISVFIAFFSLMAVAIGLERLYQGRVSSRTGKVVFYVLLCFVTVVALLDQTSRSYIPNYRDLKFEFASDAKFVRTIEESLPEGSMVFQLPYIPFPEHPPVRKMTDYDHLRGYLHSQKLRWSYGTIKNRSGDIWVRQIATLPIKEMVQSLAFADFNGIYLDRNGYTQYEAASIEAQLREALEIEPIVSDNGRLVFFKSTNSNLRFRMQFSDSEWEAKRGQTLQR